MVFCSPVKFRENCWTTFCVILFTDGQTNKEMDGSNSEKCQFVNRDNEGQGTDLPLV